ncbi:hypothetical protein [Nonomuraea dietziae]|uniref:Uncharacterized protein n=1 Tax=Nonomuraea dietziae TaxID=65515 RepID=A0A7W5V5H6_9ACTN|nr:hypothetical protein [Nonomuraea dietziae]MBB3725914.1 hypothetical protein [Nonomuraea dietziae]
MSSPSCSWPWRLLQGLGTLKTVTADALPAVAATVLSAALVAPLVVPEASRAWFARRR